MEKGAIYWQDLELNAKIIMPEQLTATSSKELSATYYRREKKSFTNKSRATERDNY